MVGGFAVAMVDLEKTTYSEQLHTNPFFENLT